MILQIYESIKYFLGITSQSEVLWIIAPLFLSTLLIITYFGIYRGEKPDWNSHFSNSFVLLFISISLIKYIYGIEDGGSFNFINYWEKTLIVISLLSIGIILIKFNFEHLLPMKFTKYISSPITVNLVAYAIILIVYSSKRITFASILSLLIMIFALAGALILINIPAKKVANYLEKEKRRERIQNAKEAAFEIDEMKKELKYREKELKKIKLKDLEKEENDTKKLRKIWKK